MIKAFDPTSPDSPTILPRIFESDDNPLRLCTMGPAFQEGIGFRNACSSAMCSSGSPLINTQQELSTHIGNQMKINKKKKRARVFCDAVQGTWSENRMIVFGYSVHALHVNYYFLTVH